MGSWSPINWNNPGDQGLQQQGNGGQGFRLFGTAASKNGINTIGCPPGYYVYQMSGRGGGAVDQLNALGCKNIITGDTTVATGGGSIGTSSGGVPVTLTSSNGNGVHALYVRNHNEVEHVMPVWRGGTGPGNCCGGVEYDANDYFGPRQNNNWRKYYCDQDHMMDSMSGGASNNNNLLTQFSFTCRNFGNMTNIRRNPLSCCTGGDSSQDCKDVQQYLSCPERRQQLL